MDERTLKILEFDKIIKMLSALTASELGKEIAEKLTPVNQYEKVQRMLKETSDGASYILRRGSPPIGGIHDIRLSLKRVEIGAVMSPSELLSTASTLGVCRVLKSYSSESRIDNEEENVIGDLINSLETNKRLEDRIKQAIVSEDEISDDASPALSTIRRQVRVLQDSIRDRLNEIIRSSKYQKYIQEALVTMRGDRYVIPVKQENRNEIAGIVHDMSASGATIFVEPMAVVEANNNIRQLKIKEQLEIERILQELTAEVELILPGLKANLLTLARLDFIFAKAKLSLELNCICPRVNKDKWILIKKGRHPLLEKHTVVPVDFWIGKDFTSLVVTGPNTGGKTVTLKTVGLFTLMTQAGLHIPANDGSEMSVFEDVFADIGDEQSIEQSLSTFSSHMKNIVRILEKAKDNSLVLFDELGAGTDPTEGAAIAMAVIEYLRGSGTISVATTHYSELKIYALSTKGVENACCEFDVETLRPTYRLLIGIPGRSNAFAISQRLGLSEGIVKIAKDFLTKEDIKFEDILQTIEKNRSQSENERMQAEAYKLQIESLRNELSEQKSRLNAQKEKILKEAREEARRILRNAKTESEDILTQLKKLEYEAKEAEKNRMSEELRLKLKTKIDSIEENLAETIMPRNTYIKPPENLKPGDSVLIINLGREGTVLIPPDNDGQAVIQAGIMKINVHVTNLKLTDTAKNESEKSGIGKIGVSKARNISPEIDLRGFNIDEASDSLDKYIDDASVAGLHEIIVIHGKGTGTLRNGIHQYLKSNPHVKSFRLGKAGEGDTGVSVVELK